jgi:hypothetical protein
MHHVCSAEYLGGYRVLVEFEDGIRKVIDLEQHLDGPIFEPLKVPAYFRLVSYNPDIETIVWPNDADFSPDFLYEIGKTATVAGGSGVWRQRGAGSGPQKKRTTRSARVAVVRKGK